MYCVFVFKYAGNVAIGKNSIPIFNHHNNLSYYIYEEVKLFISVEKFLVAYFLILYS
jgi:hypothetical protein